jgi:hypothetical protein
MVKPFNISHHSFLFSQMRDSATIEYSDISHDSEGLAVYNWQKLTTIFCQITSREIKNKQLGLANSQIYEFNLLTRRQNVEKIIELSEKPNNSVRLVIGKEKFLIVSWQHISDNYSQIFIQKISE